MNGLPYGSPSAVDETIYVRYLGRRDYQSVWQAMKSFTDERDESTQDELWFVEHDPVFTQGQAGKEEHLIAPGNIPVIQVDRGGQVTYHGPGQQVVYVMINLKRRSMGVRQLVTGIEQSIVTLLEKYSIDSAARADAPGVYLANGDKICSIGLRISKGCSFHGLALNVAPDLEPFSRINPCGLKGLQVTSMKQQTTSTFNIVSNINPMKMVEDNLATSLADCLGYNGWSKVSDPDKI